MVETTRSLEDIDALLQRNWFLDRDDIVGLLYLATEEDWQWIVANRKRYDICIEDIICCEAGLPKLKTKMRFRDLSSKEYDQIMFEAEKQASILAENRWQEYRRLNNIQPPPTRYEEALNKLHIDYNKEHGEYKKYGINKERVATRIQTLKNEIERLQDKIAQENRDWEFLAKAEFRINGTLPKLSP